MNKVIIMGNLGADPELRYSQNDKAVTTFNVATSERWSDKDGNKQEKTEWHRVVVFGRLAETCSKYLSKGGKCLVEGKIQTRSWEDNGQKRFTTEILAQNVQFVTFNSGDQPERDSTDSVFDQSFNDDDIPF